MKRSSMIALGAVMAVALLPLAGGAKNNPLTMKAFVLRPPASAAPSGRWSFVQPYGYLWIPGTAWGIMEAEWAPWDPWWTMPYGRWAWAEGCGWGWTPMMNWEDMSQLGWGYDGWGGGCYGFTPYGGPFSPPLRRAGWWKNHGYRDLNDATTRGARSRTEPSRVKVLKVLAKPPATLTPIRPMGDRGGGAAPGQGLRGHDRPSGRQHPRNGDSRIEPTFRGGLHGNENTDGQGSRPPMGMGYSGRAHAPPRTGGGNGRPRR